MKVINVVKYEADGEMFAWIYDSKKLRLVRARIDVEHSVNPKHTPETPEAVLKELRKEPT